MKSVVRPADKADIAELSRTLGRAFDDDPVMQWMWPKQRARAAGLPRLFASITRHHHLARGGVEVAMSADGAIAGAALWDPPNGWQQSRLADLLTMPSMIRAFGTRVAVGGEVAETMKRHHPAEPHWYLAVIGTDPAVRGTGLGHALMRSRLERCDAEHAPAYLESSKPENVPYYERFGFEVTKEIVIPNGGPSLWAMWRNPV